MLLLAWPPSGVRADDAPERVLVVYNADFPDLDGDGTGDSEAVALHYLERRKVPRDHLLAVHCPVETTWSGNAGWADFFHSLVEPIRDRLKILGEEQVYYILTCYGVPHTFHKKSGYQDRAVDNLLANLWDLGTADKKKLPYMWWKNPYTEFSPGVPPDTGHFDHSFTFNGKNIYLVTRLSGSSADHAKDLVDQALYAEAYLSPAPGHYQGLLYIDTQYKAYTDPELQGYPFGYATYEAADKSIAFAKFWAAASGYAWKWENTSGGLEIGDPGAQYHDGTPADAAPRALLYAGWYNHTKYNDVWSWIPGSAGCDLNSLSILGIREEDPDQFLPSAFQRGLSCGAGVIYEPTLGGHYRPEVLFYHLLHGFNFAESAALANPALCFVDMAVGDPLYNPHRAGKVPRVDQTPPPAPLLHLGPFQAGAKAVRAELPSSTAAPEVVRAEVDWGPDRRYTCHAASHTGYRRAHTVLLDGLAASTIYHFRVRIRDPAGHETASPDYLFFTRDPDPVIAVIDADPSTVPAGVPFTLDLVLSSQGGLDRITSLSLALTAPHLGIFGMDVTPLLSALPAETGTDPEEWTAGVRSRWPGFPVAGKYGFELSVKHASGGTASAQVTVTVR